MKPQGSCSRAQHLPDLLDGQLPEQESLDLQQHIETCAACQRALADLVDADPSVEKVSEHLRELNVAAETALRSAMAEMRSSEEGETGTAASNSEISLNFLDPSDASGSHGRLGQYEITDIVGRGGMGIVLKGHDTGLGRVVAIKVLAPEMASNANARKRFLREARAAAAVSHDHVVTIYAVEEDRLPYLVMEYVDGQSLQEKIDCQGQLELKEILRIGRQVAAGLAAAHAQGLIHRDVKPSNILLQNGVERVQITDFGLARAVDDAAITRTGEVAGTPEYMSPEQADGKAIDQRTDLFSLGSVLYAMCAGRSPFRAESTPRAMRRVCEDRPRPIRDVNPDLPSWLADVIDKLLAKDPNDRFQTAAEVEALLGSCLAHVQDPSGTSLPHSVPPPKPKRRRRAWFVVAVAVVVLAAGLGLTEGTGVTRFTAAVIRVVTGEGTLVIEVDDPAIGVTIEGRDLVISGAGPRELRLRPGQYRLRATKDGWPIPIEQELVTITRGGRKVLRIVQEAEPPADIVGEVLRFTEHSWHVWGAAFSPDGQYVLSVGGPDVLLWDVKTGAVVRRYEGHGDPNVDGALSVAFSPEGDRFFTGGADGAIRMRDLRTGDLVRRFDEQAGFLIMALSPDGERILSTSGDSQTARIWNVRTGEESRQFTSHTGVIHSVALAPDGGRALTADHDGVVLYWNTETGEILRRFAGHCGSLSFHPDGRHAMTGTMQDVVLLDLETGREVRRFQGHSEPVGTVVFSPDGRRALSASNDLTVRLWDVETGDPLACFEGHTDRPWALAFSPDGRFALSGSWRLDGSVRVWSLPAAKAARTEAEGEGPAELMDD